MRSHSKRRTVLTVLAGITLSLLSYWDVYQPSCLIENQSGTTLNDIQTLFDIGDECWVECPTNTDYVACGYTWLNYAILSMHFRCGSQKIEKIFNPPVVIAPYERIRIVIGPRPDYVLTTRRSKSILAQLLPIPRDNRPPRRSSSLHPSSR